MEHLRSVRASVRFGAFELDQDAGELRKQGTRMKLQEQPLQMLQVLLQRPGEVVTREELQQKIWPSDTFVDFDHGINNAIKRLREALGDAAGEAMTKRQVTNYTRPTPSGVPIAGRSPNQTIPSPRD